MTQDRILLSRRTAMQTLTVGAAALAMNDVASAPAKAAAPASAYNPGAHWERWAKPQDAGFKNDLQQIIDILFNKTTTSLTVIRGGKIALSYGNLE